MLEINKVYNMDCAEGLKQLGDKSTTISFTDPPYNLGKDYGEYKDNRQDYLQWMSQVINEMKRVSQKGIILLLGYQILKDFWDMLPEARLIIVHRRAIGGFDNDYFRMYRPVLSTVKPVQRSYDFWNDVRFVSEGYYCREPHFEHPARTSDDFTSKVIKTYTTEGDTIFDPFMGVYTTAVCCKKLRRNFIGFEINPAYCKIGEERLTKTQASKNLRNVFV